MANKLTKQDQFELFLTRFLFEQILYRYDLYELGLINVEKLQEAQRIIQKLGYSTNEIDEAIKEATYLKDLITDTKTYIPQTNKTRLKEWYVLFIFKRNRV